MKVKSVSKLKKRADDTFSLYIRQRYSDPHTGFATCITCGASKPWKQQQCGHYITRGSNALRYDERNAHVQCVGCNLFKKGNYPKYALFMVDKYGQSILQELEEESRPIKQFKTSDLTEIIDLYKAKVELLNN